MEQMSVVQCRWSVLAWVAWVAWVRKRGGGWKGHAYIPRDLDAHSARRLGLGHGGFLLLLIPAFNGSVNEDSAHTVSGRKRRSRVYFDPEAARLRDGKGGDRH